MNSADEQWRPIPGFDGAYSASNLGRIRSEPRCITYLNHRGVAVERPLRGYVLSLCSEGLNGYQIVQLWRSGRAKMFRVHRLVLEAFVGPKPNQLAVCRHLDDNRANNMLSNLCWGTALENSQDKYRNGSGNQYDGRTHCKHGHEYTPTNTAIYKNGTRSYRRCRTCQRARYTPKAKGENK